MDFNPLTPVHSKIKRQLTELQQDEKQVADELQWYNSLNPQTLEVEQRNHAAKAEQLWREIQTLDQGIQEISSQLDEIAPAIVRKLNLFNLVKWFKEQAATKLNLFKWFEDQVALRRRDAELRAVSSDKALQKYSKETELKDTQTRIASVANKLEQHRTFALSDRQDELSRIKQSIADKTAELDSITDRKLQVDKVLAPLLREMENLESEQSDIRWSLEKAENFEQQLSFAGSPKERAMIHQQCEQYFGVGEGNPRKIISERLRKLQKLERGYDKALKHLEKVAEKATRRIDKVVIDGNNLCYKYKRRDFIGLVAIEAILPQLSRMCEVVIVFDSDICGILNTNASVLNKRLGSFATVHVVATLKKADETVLDLASMNEFSYVLRAWKETTSCILKRVVAGMKEIIPFRTNPAVGQIHSCHFSI